MNGLLTTEQLAEQLHLQPDTIRRWGRAGKIPRLKLSGKVIRFNLIEVEQALQKKSCERPSPVKRTIFSQAIWNLRLINIYLIAKRRLPPVVVESHFGSSWRQRAEIQRRFTWPLARLFIRAGNWNCGLWTAAPAGTVRNGKVFWNVKEMAKSRKSKPERLGEILPRVLKRIQRRMKKVKIETK